MILLPDKTLQVLRDLINEKTIYRTGPDLVKLFNQLGFNDVYGAGFPSRKIYTEERLNIINGKPELDKCIKIIFDPINFIGEINRLDNLIANFNDYLSFNNLKVIRNGKEISFEKTNSINEVLKKQSKENLDYNEFLSIKFEEINLQYIIKDVNIGKVLQNRLEEIKKNIKNDLNLSAVIMMGSFLEGILLSIETYYPKIFNQSSSAPKKNGKVKNFVEWSLSDSINVAYELGFISEDVKKFGHNLRDFRNYIHPYQQMSSQFFPNKDTSEICFQVIKAAINQINNKIKELS